jgi:hypothetical protein
MDGITPKQWKRGQRPKQHRNKPDDLNLDVRIPFFKNILVRKEDFRYGA